MLFDIHVHTTYSSCSDIDINYILDNAKSLGLDGVCITDHGSMNALAEIKQGLQTDGLCIIAGMEYSTFDGDFLIFGDIKDIKPALPAVKLLRLIEDRGGAAVAAHPFRSDRGISEFIIRDGHCNIVETINGGNNDRENNMIHTWKDKYRFRECGGSDAHVPSMLGAVVTKFEDTIKSEEEFIKALKCGKYAPLVYSSK